MVLPIGDAPNPRGVPIVNYLLIAANVAMYVLVAVPLGAEHPARNDPVLAEYLRVVAHALEGRIPLAVLAEQTTRYDLFVFTHGFRPAHPAMGDFFTSMFLHAGLLHLAGNMLFLWIYGDNVEQCLGAFRYLVAYLVFGAAATAFHWAGAPGSMLPVVGASGAISGVLGCYFVWFPRNVVRLLWLFPPFIGQVMEVPARVVLGFYLVADNVLPYLVSDSEGGVAHGAHIGGFVAGVTLAWVWNRRGLVAKETRWHGEAANGGDVGSLIDAGRFAEAARAYLSRPARAIGAGPTPTQAMALAGWLRDARQPEAAVVVLRRLLRQTGDERALARAHLALGLLLLEDLDQPTPAYQHLLSVLDLDADPDSVDAARKALRAIAARQKRPLGWTGPR